MPPGARPVAKLPRERAAELGLTGDDKRVFDDLNIRFMVLTDTKKIHGRTFQSINMDEQLERFLWRIFNNRPIMTERPQGENIAKDIYHIYMSNSGMNTVSNYQDNKRLVDEVWEQVRNHRLLQNGALQNERDRNDNPIFLRGMHNFMKKNQLAERYFYDFIYFQIERGEATYRLYLNVKMAFMARVVGHIKNYLDTTNNHGVKDFKLAGPASMSIRKDTIVCYCSSRDTARQLADQLIDLRDHFDSDVPAMTSKYADGMSFGAEPVSQATGFSAAKYSGNAELESRQSFGSIRSQLIAMAVVEYNANKHLFGETFLAFKQFVTVAFLSHGLSTRNPGDNN